MYFRKGVSPRTIHPPLATLLENRRNRKYATANGPHDGTMSENHAGKTCVRLLDSKAAAAAGDATPARACANVHKNATRFRTRHARVLETDAQTGRTGGACART